jgi:hypothetical protein
MSDVGRFFRQQQAVATHGHWQLLQLAPTGTPGLFKLWALADSALYCVPLRVPRRVVINSDSSQPPLSAATLASLPGAVLANARAILPPGDAARNLHEVCGRSCAQLFECASGLGVSRASG